MSTCKDVIAHGCGALNEHDCLPQHFPSALGVVAAPPFTRSPSDRESVPRRGAAHKMRGPTGQRFAAEGTRAHGRRVVRGKGATETCKGHTHETYAASAARRSAGEAKASAWPSPNRNTPTAARLEGMTKKMRSAVTGNRMWFR
jgi:hypothetical protein